jgi:hypothetical protein
MIEGANNLAIFANNSHSMAWKDSAFRKIARIRLDNHGAVYPFNLSSSCCGLFVFCAKIRGPDEKCTILCVKTREKVTSSVPHPKRVSLFRFGCIRVCVFGGFIFLDPSNLSGLRSSSCTSCHRSIHFPLVDLLFPC